MATLRVSLFVRFETALESSSTQTGEKPPKKGRTQYEKVGKYEYILDKFDTLNRELKRIKIFMRYLGKGLEHSLVFEPEYVQDLACRDEMDRQILWELRGAGEYGMLPRDIAARLGDKRFTRFYVTARLIQMNKKLDAILGQRVAEKRGKNWALTAFMRSTWDSTKEELAEGS
jgi:hypothetical protein